MAQAVLLDESFDGGSVPPAGWVELNNNVSPGWEAGTSRAVHADYYGANDNRLVTPALDFTTGSAFGLHLTHDQLFARYRDQNEIEVSLDGGVTFARLAVIETPVDGTGLLVELDVSAYAGLPDVRFAFRYVGDFANEWSLDRVLVDDQPPAERPRWPELPNAFVPWEGFSERFDALAGVVPPYLAVNALDADTRLPDVEAWCNLGQQAPSQVAFSGQTSVELGLDPQSANFHKVANAVIFGFDGATMTNTAFELMVWQAGEELDEDDGIFVSVDGMDWVALRTDWGRITNGPQYLKQWRRVVGDLAHAGLDLSGSFYLAISQADDFPFGTQDGVAVDDLVCGGDVVPLRYEIRNAVGGQRADFLVTGLNPDAFVAYLYSFAGPGPSETVYGTADLGTPSQTLAMVDADRNGTAAISLVVPPYLSGTTVWTQAVEILGTGGRFSNGLEVTIQ